MQPAAAPSTFGEVFFDGFGAYANYLKGSFANPDVHNPLIYLFVVYFIAFSLENLAPKRLNYPVVKRKGFWTDILYLIFIDFGIQVIGLYAIASGIEFITLHLLAESGAPVPLINLHDKLPPWSRFFVFFIVIDFLQWIAHFVLHRSNFLWQFHKIHHAQEQLGFASTRHFHFGEYLVLKPAFWIPFALCGFKAENYVIWYVWVAYMLTFLSHCNVKINWGPLKYIFITPETHFWHHSRNIPRRFGVNYASSLVIWDLIFGFFYNPKDKEPILGIPDNDVPDSFRGQLAYPFKAIFRMKSSPPQNKDKEVVSTLTRQEKRKSRR
ncbi:MAG TPA: sterol desaturase family protein [Bacteroidia bacterium]|nr:sterol desaturase family protein [Bacteroidia bacterium]